MSMPLNQKTTWIIVSSCILKSSYTWWWHFVKVPLSFNC